MVSSCEFGIYLVISIPVACTQGLLVLLLVQFGYSASLERLTRVQCRGTYRLWYEGCHQAYHTIRPRHVLSTDTPGNQALATFQVRVVSWKPEVTYRTFFLL